MLRSTEEGDGSRYRICSLFYRKRLGGLAVASGGLGAGGDSVVCPNSATPVTECGEGHSWVHAASDCNGHSILAEQICVLLYYTGHSVEKAMVLFVAKVSASHLEVLFPEIATMSTTKHSPQQYTSLCFASVNTAKRPRITTNQMKRRVYLCCHIFILHSSCKRRNL